MGRNGTAASLKDRGGGLGRGLGSVWVGEEDLHI
jgi:hypothetical protein